MTDAAPQEAGDAELAARVAAGDEVAFQRLADRHVGRLLRLAQRMLGDADEADDVAQEALVRLWLHAGRWRPERSRLATWLHTVVFRLCLDRLRARRSAGPGGGEEAAAAAAEVAAGDPSLDSVAREEDLRRLEVALAALPARQRGALALHYHEELSGREAAEVMGVSVRAFWALLHRARGAAHDLLRRGDDRGAGIGGRR